MFLLLVGILDGHNREIQAWESAYDELKWDPSEWI